MTDFQVPAGHASASITVEDRPRGAWVCVSLLGRTGDREFSDEIKKGLSLLRAAMTESFGERFTAMSACHTGGREPYWPDGR